MKSSLFKFLDFCNKLKMIKYSQAYTLWENMTYKILSDFVAHLIANLRHIA